MLQQNEEERPHVSSRYKYQSCDDKRRSGEKLKGFCFCVTADNSFQTYLVLHRNVSVNLFQRQKNAMIKFLPSATGTRTREDNTRQGHCIHILEQGSSCLFPCCCFPFDIPAKEYEFGGDVQGKGMLAKVQSESGRCGGL